VILATEPFMGMARAVAASLDYPDARIVAVEHPIGAIDDETLEAKIRSAAGRIADALLQVDGGSE
jgi:hypothetical protein